MSHFLRRHFYFREIALGFFFKRKERERERSIANLNGNFFCSFFRRLDRQTDTAGDVGGGDDDGALSGCVIDFTS